ncbi:MAG: hypothetical protein AAGA21_05545 [Pseudomonadota bacterium]
MMDQALENVSRSSRPHSTLGEIGEAVDPSSFTCHYRLASQTSKGNDRPPRLVAEEPDLTLKQIGERLAANGIHVSKSCLHTFLWRNRIR